LISFDVKGAYNGVCPEKWLVGSKPCVSTACEILSATTDSSILPSVARSEIGVTDGC
jgi:hypothetical protein